MIAKSTLSSEARELLETLLAKDAGNLSLAEAQILYARRDYLNKTEIKELEKPFAWVVKHGKEVAKEEAKVAKENVIEEAEIVEPVVVVEEPAAVVEE